MRYQLVLQFAADRDLYDRPGRDRAQLISALERMRSDGHDMGSGEAEIYFFQRLIRDNVSAGASALERTGPYGGSHGSLPSHR